MQFEAVPSLAGVVREAHLQEWLQGYDGHAAGAGQGPAVHSGPRRLIFGHSIKLAKN